VDEFGILLVIRSRRRSRQPVSAVASRVLIFVDNDCANDGAASRPSRLSFGAAGRRCPVYPIAARRLIRCCVAHLNGIFAFTPDVEIRKAESIG
jgi:hypothetical protein